MDVLEVEKAEICRLMKVIPDPNRMADIVFCATMFKQGQLEGTEVFGIILHKTWATQDEQDLFDKCLALFLKTPEPPEEPQ